LLSGTIFEILESVQLTLEIVVGRGVLVVDEFVVERALHAWSVLAVFASLLTQRSF